MTPAEHSAALIEIERLWGSPEGTPDGDRLTALIEKVSAYEDEHFPMGRFFDEEG